ncbi:MAG: hypothetical protein ACC661_00295 [Verrucomicrobiales bacterium]
MDDELSGIIAKGVNGMIDEASREPINPKDTTDRRTTVELEPLFLANLADDIGETTNRAAQHPEIVARLQQLRDAHAASITQSNLGR